MFEQPLARLHLAARVDDDDLLVHGHCGRPEQRVEADDGAVVAAQHRLERLALEAGDVGQHAAAGQQRRDAGGGGGGLAYRHRQKAEIDAGGERFRPGPIVDLQDTNLVVGLGEPVAEEAAHVAASADHENLGAGAHAAPPQRVQLPHARMAQHGPKQALDVIRVQAGLNGLGAAGGDEVFLAGGMGGRQRVLVFDLRDPLDDELALGQQLDQLPVNAVDLLAQLLQGWAGQGGRWFRRLFVHG